MEQRPLHILLREKRRELGIGQAGLAERLSVSVSTLRAVEIGKHFVRSEGTTRVAGFAMGIPLGPPYSDRSWDKAYAAIDASAELARRALVVPGSLAGRLAERNVTIARLNHKNYAALIWAAPSSALSSMKPLTRLGIVREIVGGWMFPVAYHPQWQDLARITEAQFEEMRIVHRRALAAWITEIGGDLSEVGLDDLSEGNSVPASTDDELGRPAFVVTAHHVLAVYAAGALPADLPIAFFTEGARGAAGEVAARIGGAVRKTLAVRLPDGRLHLLGSAIEPITSADMADIAAAISVASDERKTLLMSVLNVPTSS